MLYSVCHSHYEAAVTDCGLQRRLENVGRVNTFKGTVGFTPSGQYNQHAQRDVKRFYCNFKVLFSSVDQSDDAVAAQEVKTYL